MKPMRIVFKYAGVVCIPVYIIFTLLSYFHNPQINPMTNWLSDYGNPLINPSGAIYYNTGCIIVALLLIVFNIGLYRWYRGSNIKKKYLICFVCAQISGMLSNLFLILGALFPLGTHTQLHSLSSLFHMIGTDCFLAFTATFFLLNPNFKKWIGIFGFLIAIFNIITTNTFSNLFIAEWIYFLLFMIYMVIILRQEDQILPPQMNQEIGRFEPPLKPGA